MLYHDKPGDCARMDQQCISNAEGFVQLSSLLTQTSLSCPRNIRLPNASAPAAGSSVMQLPLRPAAAAPATRSSLSATPTGKAASSALCLHSHFAFPSLQTSEKVRSEFSAQCTTPQAAWRGFQITELSAMLCCDVDLRLQSVDISISQICSLLLPSAILQLAMHLPSDSRSGC